jgi:SPP1 family predicted phage head-tail adaptor
MPAGRYKQRITIQDPARLKNSTGEVESVWTEHSSRWAEVRELSGSERYIDPVVMETASHQVKMRYEPGITQDMRILYDGKTLDIRSIIDPDERKRELVLICRETTD